MMFALLTKFYNEFLAPFPSPTRQKKLKKFTQTWSRASKWTGCFQGDVGKRENDWFVCALISIEAERNAPDGTDWNSGARTFSTTWANMLRWWKFDWFANGFKSKRANANKFTRRCKAECEDPIGTHALLEEEVGFQNLGLAIYWWAHPVQKWHNAPTLE